MGSLDTTRIKFKRTTRNLVPEKSKLPKIETDFLKESYEKAASAYIANVVKNTLGKAINPPAETLKTGSQPEATTTESSNNILNTYPYYQRKSLNSRSVIDEVGNKEGTLGAWLYAVLYRNRERWRTYEQIEAEVLYLCPTRIRDRPSTRVSIKGYLSSLGNKRGFKVKKLRGLATRTLCYQLDYTTVNRKFDFGYRSLNYAIDRLPDDLK